MKDVADDLALIVRNAIAYIKDLERQVNELKRAAEPVQEPVAWGVFDGPNLHDVNFTEEEAHEMVRLKGDGSVVKPLYTAPPQRKPLTEEEIDSIWDSEKAFADIYAITRAIERAIWEKNNG